MTTPGWLYALSEVSPENSPPPYEFEITFAPSAAASFSAVSRFANEFVLASTSRILQFWQIWCTVSTSSAISRCQLVLDENDVPPFWSTFLKQPFAVVHDGRPYCVSYAARSDSMFGSSN